MSITRYKSGTAGEALKALSGWFLLGILYSIDLIQHPLYTENQNTKFLHAAAKTGQGFLEHDWMANTLDPLPLFSFLIESLYRMGTIEVVYILFALLAAVFLYAMTGIADHLFGLKRHPVAVWLFLAVLFLEYKNIQLGFGTQYLLGHYLQPCVFGVFILLSIERFLNEKPLWASAWLALAAAFHPAYMPSALLIQGSYTLVTLQKQKKISGELLLPLLLFIVVSAPLVIRYKLLFAPSSPSISYEALTILSEQRIATHTKVRNWLNYEDYIGMALIAISMIIARKTVLFRIMLPLAVLIFVTVPFLYYYSWPALEVLTPWRTSVLLLPLAWAILGGWLIVKLFPLFETKRFVVQSAKSIAVITIAVTTGLHLPLQLKRFSDYRNTPEMAVLTFAKRHTVSKDLWLVPSRKTEFEKVRMQGGIPVLVNWKTHPYKDREILEWYRRNRLAEAFYSHACKTESSLILRKLARLYGVNHVILAAGTPLQACPQAKVIFRDSHYIAIELPASWSVAQKKHSFNNHSNRRTQLVPVVHHTRALLHPQHNI